MKITSQSYLIFLLRGYKCNFEIYAEERQKKKIKHFCDYLILFK